MSWREAGLLNLPKIKTPMCLFTQGPSKRHIWKEELPKIGYGYSSHRSMICMVRYGVHILYPT
ncbi:C6 transcription factor [Aspergillus luchuensis]|uniref:C6 transcription factor n=1 Tax=Aspergillus kawachii TaxID=1069201 RepID=A0A146FXW1_ASPKA|nr:C6 transcription factor [Aspergillus luchuensis]